MALHARVFTHILRVSKLKQLSHTTQAIERNSEKTSVACWTQTTNATTEEEKRREGADLQFPSSPQWSLQPFCLDHLALTTNTRTTCQSLSVEKRKTPEKSLTTVSLFPQECLPWVVKPVSYTTDDIMTCTVDQQRHHHLRHSMVVYENHPITMLMERCSGPQHESSLAKDTASTVGEGPRWDGQTDGLSPLHSPSSFRRHSVCESHSSDCRPHFSDSSVRQSVVGLGSQMMCTSSPALSPDAVLYCSGSDIPQRGGDGKEARGPSLDQLRAVETFFIETLPKFFKSRLDYRVYHPDIVFKNNFWGENQRSVGINQYAMQLTKLRALTHLKYAHVHMEVVSSACLPEEGRIRIQWRIVGLSQFKALRFWKYSAWSYGKSFREDAEWIDGVSNLHVDKDGLVTKHRLDRMTPDEEQLSKSPSLAAKLALLFGLASPRPSLSDCTSLLCRR